MPIGLPLNEFITRVMLSIKNTELGDGEITFDLFVVVNNGGIYIVDADQESVQKACVQHLTFTMGNKNTHD